MKLGLRARTHALPHEAPQVAARADEWHDHYQPQSPAACHLTNECARATVLADRCDRYRQATLAQQVKEARQRWDRRRRRKVTALVNRLPLEPATATAGLKSFAHGLRWIIGFYGQLIKVTRDHGRWMQEDFETVIRLYGIHPVPEEIRQHALSYTLQVCHLVCTPGVAPDVIDAWQAPDARR
jgi:hypothetical protein